MQDIIIAIYRYIDQTITSSTSSNHNHHLKVKYQLPINNAHLPNAS
jgi:hypothetical protein